MEEIWKDIAGYEGRYQVSNFGNVKSLRYRGSFNEKLLTPKVNKDGYLWVQLFWKSKSKCYLIHRLVGSAFIDNPDNFPCINHKDENRQNNNVSNLEWCTHLYNVRYSVLRHPIRIRKPSKSSKISQFSKDGIFVREWDNLVSIKHETGWNNWSIDECCKGNRKSAYGYKWQYVI